MIRTAIVMILGMASAALAERRELTVDAAVSWALDPVAAPNAVTPASTFSMGPAVLLGARYGIRHFLDVAAVGFFEIPVQVGHNNMVLRTSNGDFAGTLVHNTMRFGAMAGPRLVFGMGWRFSLGLDLGWAQRIDTGLQMIDDSNQAAPIDYGLTLANTSRGNFLVSPVVSIEWAAGDHWSVGFTPRAQIAFGRDGGWSVFLPIQFSWGWYL